MDAFDREVEHLETELAEGTISQEEFNRTMRELERDDREAGFEAAENAAKQVLRNW